MKKVTDVLSATLKLPPGIKHQPVSLKIKRFQRLFHPVGDGANVFPVVFSIIGISIEKAVNRGINRAAVIRRQALQVAQKPLQMCFGDFSQHLVAHQPDVFIHPFE